MTPIDRYLEAIADADPYPYWLDDVDEPVSKPTLVRTESCDLCIVGGGYTGLWTALIAKEREPDRDIVLIDAFTVGSAASGRNGGFMESSLTHGIANGQARFPEELAALEELGLDNLDEIEAGRRRYDIDCDYERTGVIDVTTYEAGIDDFREDYRQLASLGQDVVLLDRDAMQAEIHSPTYQGVSGGRVGRRLVDPARLAWGLKAAAEAAGVRIYEDTKAVVDRTRRCRGVGQDPAGPGAGGPGGAGHQCLQATPQEDAATTSSRSTTTPWSPSR